MLTPVYLQGNTGFNYIAAFVCQVIINLDTVSIYCIQAWICSVSYSYVAYIHTYLGATSWPLLTLGFQIHFKCLLPYIRHDISVGNVTVITTMITIEDLGNVN